MKLTAAKTLTFIAILSTPAICNADIYKCVSEGRTQFSDKPCAGQGGTQEIRETETPEPKEREGKVVYLSGFKSERDAVEKLYEKGPGDTRSNADLAKERSDRRMRDEEWKRRNMSVGCIMEKHNAWLRGTSTKPTNEESEKKHNEFRRECRKIFRLPEEMPPLVKSPKNNH